MELLNVLHYSTVLWDFTKFKFKVACKRKKDKNYME